MAAIRAQEGWFVLHSYYRIDRRIWNRSNSEERLRCRQALAEIVASTRKQDHCQVETYAVWGSKADWGYMLVDPDLDRLNDTENRIHVAFPPGAAVPAQSFTSMTEISEYISQEKDYDRTLREKEGLSPDSAPYREKMEAYRNRIRGYIEERLHPVLPEHKVMCFYPMNKARRDQANWYTLDFDDRKRMMGGHLITGRKFAGKVKQLVTGSMGLDNWEWGVTLFADDPFYFKKILYDMRYDEVSAVYGEFGDFLVGIRLDTEVLFDRLQL